MFIEGLDAGASYEVCSQAFYAGGIAFVNADARPDIGTACGGFDGSKTCVSLDGSSGSTRLLQQERGGIGGSLRNDDILTVIEVRATFSEGGTCGGYTLRFKS